MFGLKPSKAALNALSTFRKENIDAIGLFNSTKPERFSEYYYKIDIRNFQEV